MYLIVKTCPAPPIPENGGRDGNVFSFGSTIRITCNEGFRMAGLPYRTCQGDQTWSGYDPHCRRKYTLFSIIITLSCDDDPQMRGLSQTHQGVRGYEWRTTNRSEHVIIQSLLPREIVITNPKSISDIRNDIENGISDDETHEI